MAVLKPEYPILVVDDEPDILFTYSFALKSQGITNYLTADSGKKALAILEDTRVSLLVLDLYMPDYRGDEILEIVSEKYPETPVIIITAANDAEVAVRCLKLGAEDFILKPVDKLRFLTSIKNSLEKAELRSHLHSLGSLENNSNLNNPDAFKTIITKNDKLKNVFKYMEKVSKSSQPVLITGETGTGKELFSAVIHNLSGLEGEYVTVNVAGLDDNMFSDTLFGHVKGAFTGAVSNRKGLLEVADGGTIFLDEIGDLSESSQIKLLRFIQEGTYRPLGSDKELKSSARVVVATNVNLSENVEKGKFRKDLYYRLMTHRVNIIPLRERLDDIEPLFSYLYDEACEDIGLQIYEYSDEAIKLLKGYDYPGNVRELRGMIFDLVARSSGKIIGKDVKDYFKETGRRYKSAVPEADCDFKFDGKFPTLKDMEEALIEKALQAAEGNQSRAAKLLGISRQALSKRLLKKP